MDTTIPTPHYLSYFHHTIRHIQNTGPTKTMTQFAAPNPFHFAPPTCGIIGHRGHPNGAPENTLASFESAALTGATWVEFDIQLTKDNQWIVIHDDTLDRTTNGHGLVTDFTLAELQNLEITNYPTLLQQPIPQKIPRLVDVLNLCDKYHLTPNIEIKLPDDCPPELFKRSAEYFIQFIRTYYSTIPLATHQNTPNYPFLVSSFNHEILETVRQALPRLPLGFLCENLTQVQLHKIREYTPAALNISSEAITPSLIQQAAKLNIPVLVYTINSLESASQLLDSGAYGIFTDNCEIMLKQLKCNPHSPNTPPKY